MREKKYTRTIAVRVTDDEYQVIQQECEKHGLKNTTGFVRKLIEAAVAAVRK